MLLTPEILLKTLADPTRLRSILLLEAAGELCVCDLISILELEQPKISRHLAILRKADMVEDRREGQWVYYRLHANLPLWAMETLQALIRGSSAQAPYQQDRLKLDTSSANSCC